MEPLSLSEYLHNGNPWTARLLGTAPFSRTRDRAQVEREYNDSKYKTLLDFKAATIDECKRKEFELAGLGEESDVVISFGDGLFRARLGEMRRMFYRIVRDAVTRFASRNVCELGCGYGYNLTYLPGTVSGGEYCANAVELARRYGMKVRPFDYYDASTYDLIPQDATIVTIHSVEQIPDATPIIKNLRMHRASIRTVVHIEPSYVAERSGGLLGTLRNRYIELNDYNRNLRAELSKCDDIEIIDEQLDLVGLNPLNSAHLITWRFRSY